jgi:hypothetical protein
MMVDKFIELKIVPMILLGVAFGALRYFLGA